MSQVNWTNLTDLTYLPQAAGTASNGAFWPMVAYLVFAVAFLMLIAYGFEVAIMVASFIGLIISFILVYSGVMNWTYLLPFVGMILMMFLYISYSSNKVKY